MNNINNIYTDVLEIIKQFLSFKDRIQFLLICSNTCRLQLDYFDKYQLKIITYPGRDDVTYQFYCNRFYNPLLSPPKPSFLGNNYVNIIIFDTPYTYYNIRIMKPYEVNKLIQDYLKTYEPYKYHINKITKYYS